MHKMVSIPKVSFSFCRIFSSVLIWSAFIFKLKWMTLVTLAIFALSAILGIKKAPLPTIFTLLFGKIFKLKEELVDLKAIRFVHTLGTIFNLVIVVLLYLVNEKIGWVVLFVFAVLKTFMAFGVCPAAKLYNCLAGGGNGSCCSFFNNGKSCKK